MMDPQTASSIRRRALVGLEWTVENDDDSFEIETALFFLIRETEEGSALEAALERAYETVSVVSPEHAATCPGSLLTAEKWCALVPELAEAIRATEHLPPSSLFA